MDQKNLPREISIERSICPFSISPRCIKTDSKCARDDSTARYHISNIKNHEKGLKMLSNHLLTWGKAEGPKLHFWPKKCHMRKLELKIDLSIKTKYYHPKNIFEVRARQLCPEIADPNTQISEKSTKSSKSPHFRL